MDPKDLVSLTQDHATTTSLIVAEKFGKRHKDVLRTIEKLIAELPDEEFSRRNFAPSTWTNERGKTYPMYLIARDGFSLLAMGFTGKEALAWKLKFIAAFNQLEALAAGQIPEKRLRFRLSLAEVRIRIMEHALFQDHPAWPVIREAKLEGLTDRETCALTGHKSPQSIRRNLGRMRSYAVDLPWLPVRSN